MNNDDSIHTLTNIIDTLIPKPDFTDVDVDEFRESIYLIIEE